MWGVTQTRRVEHLEEGHLEHHVELHRRLRVVALEVRRERPRRREEDDVADDDRQHERSDKHDFNNDRGGCILVDTNNPPIRG